MNNIKKATFNKSDLEIISSKYADNFSKFKSRMALIFVFAIAFLFVPAKYLSFLRKRGARFSSEPNPNNMIESFGLVNALIFVIIFIILTGLLFYWMFDIKKFKKDLQDKLKIVAKVTVEKVESYSAKEIKELQKMDRDFTDELKFESNEYGIDDYQFNRVTEPDLLNAKGMIIERAIHTEYEFRNEILK